MIIISIASGKGGTGKTTVATNLAVSIGLNVQLIDCDVEDPNAHLFINPFFDETEIVTTPVPQVDLKKCTRCGKCAEICQYKSIVIISETVLTLPELCHGCGGCMEICPESAISETGWELGIIQKGFFDGIEFIHGRLQVGEAMSPPLIKKVRSSAMMDRFTIIDAPPGTSCPMIESIKDTDFVLMVTEPTPFGLDDLKLAVGAAKILGIPCGLVINRSNIGDAKVKAYAKEENLPVLMEIPFDHRIAEAYSRGQLIVDVMPEWRNKFLNLYDQIKYKVDRLGTM
jgi:MinD superfamily P-loop ATPase